jgi:hypothetical protein
MQCRERYFGEKIFRPPPTPPMLSGAPTLRARAVPGHAALARSGANNTAEKK